MTSIHHGRATTWDRRSNGLVGVESLLRGREPPSATASPESPCDSRDASAADVHDDFDVRQRGPRQTFIRTEARSAGILVVVSLLLSASTSTASPLLDRMWRDVASAEASGVRGTPTFFVGDQRHTGPLRRAQPDRRARALGDRR